MKVTVIIFKVCDSVIHNSTEQHDLVNYFNQ